MGILENILIMKATHWVAFFIESMQRIRVIGGGLAGSIFAMQALERGYTVEWWTWGRPSSSLVAAGISNPLALKRLKFIQRAEDFMNSSRAFYHWLESETGRSFYQTLPLYHILYTDGEINDWEVKAESPLGEKYLWRISRNAELNRILGELNNVGWLDTEVFLEVTQEMKSPSLNLIERCWNISDLNDEIETVLCQGWKSDTLTFGIEPKAFNPAKGEVIIIFSESFPIRDGILHGGVFVLPLGNHLYKIGSTYTWDDLNELPSATGLEFLIEEFEKLWKGEYHLISHLAAVRPTTRDRKPLVGRVPNYKNLSVFNGMGSRAVLMAPLLSLELLAHLFEGSELPSEVSTLRFLAK